MRYTISLFIFFALSVIFLFFVFFSYFLLFFAFICVCANTQINISYSEFDARIV